MTERAGQLHARGKCDPGRRSSPMASPVLSPKVVGGCRLAVIEAWSHTIVTKVPAAQNVTSSAVQVANIADIPNRYLPPPPASRAFSLSPHGLFLPALSELNLNGHGDQYRGAARCGSITCLQCIYVVPSASTLDLEFD